MKMTTAPRCRSAPCLPARSRWTSRSASAGLPRGRIVEIFGPESSGKTTLVYHVIAEAQRRGASARYRREHSMDPAYAKMDRRDIDNLSSRSRTPASRLEITELRDPLGRARRRRDRLGPR